MSLQPPLPGFASRPGTDLTSAADLRHYPNVPGSTLARHGRLIGRAGEDLVASILRRHGFIVLDLDDHSADKLITVGNSICGLQIKTVTHPDMSGSWRVQARKGCSRGAGRRGYAVADFDLLAIAVLPMNVVLFTSDRSECHAIRPCEIAGLRADPMASLRQALCTIGLDLCPAPPAP
ncbi:hypothetical protein PARPLA_01671 [Rhodobacteraceae bacterium THAF1]|uniref:hypothetical protein n=1 Tax=Palleronia sp. THAF1 TaxID=2587842 RepID=UPI000F401267|nr:hypothetical protein [Palleronia sp. THAF1]QFU08811.1 hypothetical protein FIU81_09010 [Palleronia sp. THAF1]VDC23946.1 hypothetical protein PARPLA_01671 [Rhodobacteraceae bacterium THAF1]